MKKITKYKSDDGIEFSSETECLEYERNYRIADEIMAKLPARLCSTKFTNGGGYIQHSKENLLSVRNEFLELVQKYTDHSRIQKTIEEDFYNIQITSFASRLISAHAPTSIWKHWCRFTCIDNELREWGQPYFVNHPEECEMRRLN